MINKNTQQNKNPRFIKPVGRKIYPRQFPPQSNQPPKIQEKEKPSSLNLKNAGEAILIASEILTLQILLMFGFNLRLGGSVVLGVFFFIIYCLILYLLLLNRSSKTKDSKKI
jgi:hypothetical protein